MASTWSESDIPHLSSMAAVVTGANSGIGLEVARGLASKGAHVVLAVRNPERGRQAAAAIRSTSPGASLDVVVLDLADLPSVHRCADAVHGPPCSRRHQRMSMGVTSSARVDRSACGAPRPGSARVPKATTKTWRVTFGRCQKT